MSARLAGARSSSRMLLIVGLLAAVVVAVAAFVLLRNRTATAPGEIEGVKTYNYKPLLHTEEAISYPEAPPVGGEHNPRWQNCGIYDLPIQNNHAVHSLEHGAVWITYRPDTVSGADLEKLKRLVRGQPFRMLSPYPGIDAPIIAVAWNRRLEVQTADDPRLARFAQEFTQGPQTPEPGAVCSGQVGTPVE